MKIKHTFVYVIAVAALLFLEQCSSESTTISPNGGAQIGTGGSLARFAISGNSLYIATNQSLDVYDITDPVAPARTKKNMLGFGIETIFPYQQNLFIGANDGMYIFDNTKPDAPVLLTKYTHVMSCDPVVVQGKYAYVTLRGGSGCRLGDGRSFLDVVDLSDIRNPKLVNSQILLAPFGIGVDGNKLFVCEGSGGLKLFDISDPQKPMLKKTMADIPAYDVIPNQKTLIVTGEKGIFQYRYDTAETFDLLSKIAVE
ncbi:MAG: hypothetical protein EAZ70_11525 [Runella slithyformis]|nr:MAG: hypothetical protein EAY79_12295 [Runella slithyformis]TAF24697.1 MAG: hypothetical protein EAZ70_11525 [Runella slithyformis]TAF49528.1 MAG: hypothetical protein EAZ63_01120 [Runella slithyformis]TAF79359.1 MAG: hypothetical protein EAZ50_11645 [Runella slithyformis]